LKLKRLLILLFVSLPLYAQTYYIATTGDDGDNGSIGSPWATFAKAKTVLEAGDTCYVRGGTYNQAMNFADGNSGWATQPIVYKEYPGEDVIIDGDGLSVSATTGLLYTGWCTYIRFYGFEIKNSVEAGVWLDKGCWAIGLHVHDVQWAGILAGGDSAVVEDCLVHDTNLYNYNGYIDYHNGSDDLTPDGSGTPLSWTPGIILGAGDVHGSDDTAKGIICRRNILYNSWGEGIDAYDSRNTLIEDNVVYDSYANNMYLSDGGGNMVRGNLIYGTKTIPGRVENGKTARADGIEIYNEKDALGWPHYPDTVINNTIANLEVGIHIAKGPTSGRSLIANNVFMNAVGIATINLWSGAYNYDFVNNIVIQDDDKPLIVFPYGSGGTKFIFDYNLWSKEPHARAQGAHDPTYGDPLLTGGNTTAGNLTSAYFGLQSNSPAKDAGTDWGPMPYAAVGSAYDIGALELGGAATPTVTTSVSSLTNFGSVNTGSSSSSQNYTVSGTDLTDDIDITAPTHLQVSLNNSTWTSSVSLTPSGGTVSTTTVYARFTPAGTGAQSGNITHVSPSATTRNVAVGGTGIANAAPPPAPKPTSPGIGKMAQPATISLVWEASSGATSYRVQVSVDPTFATTIVDDSLITETTRQIGPLAGGTTHYWRVQARNAIGASVWFHPVWEFTTAAATSVGNKTGTPLDFELCQNYPNPFNPSTNISFSVPIASDVALIVVNILGQEVATPFKGHVLAGTYSIVFSGEGLSSGVYYYYMMAGTFSTVRRMILLK
jgi:parallel beta-helix repeat protein